MKVTFDGRAAAAAYSRAFQRFKELPGFDQRTYLRAEMGSIIKAWAGKTKVMTEDRILKSARLQAAKNLGLTQFQGQESPVTITTGARHGVVGMIWRKTSKGIPQGVGVADLNSGSVRFLNRHYKAADWNSIVASVNAYRAEYPHTLKKIKGSVGLARQSVIQIADGLGIDLNAVAGGGVNAAGIAKARAAIAANGRAYVNGYGSQAGNEVKFYVAGFTRIPYGSKIGMDRDLAGVLVRRAKYIETTYAKGAFDSMKATARAFPNIVRVAA